MAKLKDINVPTSWNKLNQWQQEEIAYLYLNANPEDFTEDYIKMVFFCYRKNESYTDYVRVDEIANQVPFSELEKHVPFLRESTDFNLFPEIKGLIPPAKGLADISIRQFSTIDTFFHIWNKDRSEINLKRLVATLYRLKPTYDDLDLPEVAKITDKISIKKMHAIALAFLFTRMHIEESFPIVFPKAKPKTEEDELTPVFKKKEQVFIPFDKVIVGIAMDELQPLGKKQDADKVRIYEFMSVLSETMLYQEAKANAGK